MLRIRRAYAAPICFRRYVAANVSLFPKNEKMSVLGNRGFRGHTSRCGRSIWAHAIFQNENCRFWEIAGGLSDGLLWDWMIDVGTLVKGYNFIVTCFWFMV